MQVGLGPGHLLLDGDLVPTPPKGPRPPQFSARICCGQMVAWIKISLGMGLWPRRLCVRWGPRSPSPKGGPSPQIFGPCLLWPNGWMDVAGLAILLGMEVGLSPGDCAIWGPSPPPAKGSGAPSPIFGPFLLWRNGWISK